MCGASNACAQTQVCRARGALAALCLGCICFSTCTYICLGAQTTTPNSYEPDTVDINADDADYYWLLKVLQDQIPTVVVSRARMGAGQW